MQKMLLLMLALTGLICLLGGCSQNLSEFSSAADESMPLETIFSDSPVSEPAASAFDPARHIVTSLDLCVTFSEDVSSRYPDVQIPLSSDELDWYYADLDSAEPDYASMEARLSVLTLRLRQSAHARIDNIRKMGNPVPDGLHDLLEEYDRRFEALGW